MIDWVVVLVAATLAIVLLLAVRSGTYMRFPSRVLLVVLAVAMLGGSALVAVFVLSFGHRGGTRTFEAVAVRDSSGDRIDVTVADAAGLVVGVDDGSGPPALTPPQSAELNAGRAVALPIPGSNDLYVRWLIVGCGPAQRLTFTGTQDHLAIAVEGDPTASAACDPVSSWVKLHLRMAIAVTDTTVDISRVGE